MSELSESEKFKTKHIADIIGEWGSWQRNLTIYVFILTAILAYNDLGFTFLAFETEYWCSDVPDDHSNKTEAMKCNKYSNSSEVCDEWKFNSHEFDKSIISEFNLVCQRSHYASLTQSFYMMGYLVSGLLLSPLPDKFGRRPLCWVYFAIEIISMIACALSVNIQQYIVFRLFAGIGGCGRTGAMCVMLMESLGPKHRSDIYLSGGLGWLVGYCIIPVVAYYVRDFRYMHWACVCPLVCMVGWLFFMTESPRWLITSGNTERAEKVLRKIVRQNNLSEDNFDEKFAELLQHMQLQEKKEQKSYTFFDLLRTPNLRKYSMIFGLSWLVIGLVYYGFSLNMSDFGGNKYISFLLGGVVELPSSLVAIVSLKYIGRKKSFFGFLMMMAVASLAVIPSTNETLKMSFALIGKFAVGTLWWVVEVYVPELYPTLMRMCASGSSQAMARLGSTVSPFMGDVASKFGISVVMIIYAIISIATALLALLLPETKGKEIPDTLDDVEYIDKDKKLAIKGNDQNGLLGSDEHAV